MRGLVVVVEPDFDVDGQAVGLLLLVGQPVAEGWVVFDVRYSKKA
jgi:hypothetical protein